MAIILPIAVKRSAIGIEGTGAECDDNVSGELVFEYSL